MQQSVFSKGQTGKHFAHIFETLNPHSSRTSLSPFTSSLSVIIFCMWPHIWMVSRFMTPDRVTDHVTGQVTFHRPFPCLSMFVDVCLHMFGHLTFFGNCI